MNSNSITSPSSRNGGTERENGYTSSVSRRRRPRDRTTQSFRVSAGWTTSGSSLETPPCSRPCVDTTPSHRVFSRTLAHSSLFTCTRMAQGVARRVFIKERSSTCHQVSDCALSLLLLTSSSLSHECLYLLLILFISSILVIILHVVGTAEHKNPCAPAERAVLPRGDTQHSHRL